MDLNYMNISPGMLFFDQNDENRLIYYHNGSHFLKQGSSCDPIRGSSQSPIEIGARTITHLFRRSPNNHQMPTVLWALSMIDVCNDALIEYARE